MTTFDFEHFAAATKQSVAEAQGLASSAFLGFEKLVALNLATAKSSLFETSGDFYAVFSAKSPTDALAAHASLAKPIAEKTVAYGRSVMAIATETGAEFTKVAEARIAESQKNFAAALDLLSKNAPSGSDQVVAAIKSAVTAGQQAVDTAKNSVRKVSELIEKQAVSASDAALEAVKASTRAQ